MQTRPTFLVVVELEAHAVVDLVVAEGDVVLVDGVPLLDADLLGPGARLRRHELLEVADGVVLVALDPHLLPQPVVEHHLDHLRPLLLPSRTLAPRVTSPPLGISRILRARGSHAARLTRSSAPSPPRRPRSPAPPPPPTPPPPPPITEVMHH